MLAARIKARTWIAPEFTYIDTDIMCTVVRLKVMHAIQRLLYVYMRKIIKDCQVFVFFSIFERTMCM